MLCAFLMPVDVVHREKDFSSPVMKFIISNKNKNSKEETPWDKEDYPLLTTWNGEQWGDMTMGQGDTVELLLVYDPERTAQIDGFSTQYTARIINRQN